MPEPNPVLDVPQQFEPATSHQVRDELVDYIMRDLLGPWGGPSEQLPPRARGPRDRYLVGMLGPKYNPRSALDAADRMPDELGAQADAEDGELPEQFSVQNAGRLWASSMGLSFAVPSDVDALAATASWGRYDKELRATEAGTERAVWARQPVEHRLTVRLDGQRRRRILLANPRPTDPQAGAEAGAANDEPAATEDADPTGEGVFLAVDVHDRPTPAGEVTRVVELALVNAQPEPAANPDTAWLFQACLMVTARDGTSPVFLPIDDPMSDVEESSAGDEEQHLRLLYRDQLSHANGRNVAVHADVHDGARRARRLTTAWLPTFDVPATIAPPLAGSPHLAGLELSMDALAELPPAGLTAALRPLADGYRAWLAERRSDVDGLPAPLRPAAHRALYRAETVADRIAAGIELLGTDPQALDAFRFANEAMALQRRHTTLAALRGSEGIGYAEALDRITALGPEAASWRPFQLAFVLLNLPALTDPADPQRRAGGGHALVDLLFFPTGGGKTEAYLGLAAYTFAVRRLQGVVGTGTDTRDGGDGVAVLMRYTLRLLTAQQFQRAAALVCAAEVLRRRDEQGRYGSEPFRIGLWVGNAVAPNWYEEAKRQVDDARTTGKGERVNVLQTLACPWCGERLRAERDLDTRDEERRVRLFCARGEGHDACPFSRRMTKDGLPILTVDEELYRYPPSLVIATVDKLAQLPWFGFAGALFGRVRQRCPRHGYRHPDLDARTGCRDRHNATDRSAAARSAPVTPLRPPDLVIQDELHLISGALGTTVGLFEAAVDQLCTWPVPAADGSGAAAAGGSVPAGGTVLTGGTVLAGPVIVASTATTKRADAQVRRLYGRDLSVFPPPALDVTDTFFSRQVPVTPHNPGRRYLGLCAHGTRLKAAEIRLAEILLLAGQSLFDRYGKPADPYLTVVGYFNATRELAGMRRFLDDDVTTRVRRNGRRRGISNRIHSRTGLLAIQELTSRISSADIAEVLKRLEYGFEPQLDTSVRREAVAAEVRAARAERRERRLPPRAGQMPVDVVLATSMLQVGVDVPRFGLMVMTGQPKNTAEYIQASSRVGRDRDRPGLVVTLYNWSRPRDLAHYEDFAHYHATFYRQVEALSVTPYARRALDRGTAATVVAALRHADDRHSPNGAAGRVPLHGPVAEEVTRRLLARARAAGGERAAEYLDERLGVLRDAWARRQQGDYSLGYTARRDAGTVYLALLDGAGDGPWGALTVPRSMRETENEVNLLAPADMAESELDAPPWTFAEPEREPEAEPEPAAAAEDTGDEFGEPVRAANGGAR
jgi:hypothetical protein